MSVIYQPPAVRADGACAVCLKVRPEVAVKAGDPFCSTVCARADHGGGTGRPVSPQTRRITETRTDLLERGRAALENVRTTVPVAAHARKPRPALAQQATLGPICHICGDEIAPSDLHFDHVIPITRGGAHTAENIRPAHARCNIAKGTKLMRELDRKRERVAA